MANCSDAFGTIRVQKVGREFLEFISASRADKEDEHYSLMSESDSQEAIVDAEGNLEMNFSTLGRWSFSNNLEGYLDAKWVEKDSEGWESYVKLVEATKKKGGSIEVSYSDSDASMDWMGTGVARLAVLDEEGGEVEFDDQFESEPINITRYCEMNDVSVFDAFDIMHSYESAVAWAKYEEECKKEGKEPVDPDTWYSEIYEEE